MFFENLNPKKNFELKTGVIMKSSTKQWNSGVQIIISGFSFKAKCLLAGAEKISFFRLYNGKARVYFFG